MSNNAFFLLEIDPCLSKHVVSIAKSNDLKLFQRKMICQDKKDV